MLAQEFPEEGKLHLHRARERLLRPRWIVQRARSCKDSFWGIIFGNKGTTKRGTFFSTVGHAYEQCDQVDHNSVNTVLHSVHIFRYFHFAQITYCQKVPYVLIKDFNKYPYISKTNQMERSFSAHSFRKGKLVFGLFITAADKTQRAKVLLGVRQRKSMQ